jgi:hypothetical protein
MGDSPPCPHGTGNQENQLIHPQRDTYSMTSDDESCSHEDTRVALRLAVSFCGFTQVLSLCVHARSVSYYFIRSQSGDDGIDGHQWRVRSAIKFAFGSSFDVSIEVTRAGIR